MKLTGSLLLLLAISPALFAACNGDDAATTTATVSPPATGSVTGTPTPGAAGMPAMTGTASPGATTDTLLPPLDCTPPADVTETQTEGPYYSEGSPERASLLEDGLEGTRLVVTGYVLNQDCEPIAGAWLDFWQADAEGVYDNEGFRLRGHQFTDANGVYWLETIIPGEYPGRTEHIHVKLRAPDGPEVTSQLYFPGAEDNETDGIFSASLLLELAQAPEGTFAMFDFVIPE